MAEGFAFRHASSRTAVPLMLMSMSGYGIRERHHVGDLGGEVEDEVLPGHETLHRGGVAHVGRVDLDVVADLADVGRIASVPLDHGVAEGDAGALGKQLAGEVRADEAEAPGDQHALAGEPSHGVRNDSTPFRAS